MTQKPTRKLFIVARCTIKKSGMSNGYFYKAGSIVYIVRNDKGVEYLVTVRLNRIHSCTCPATKPCYHIAYCSNVEDAREAAIENARSAKNLAAKLAREVEAICAEAEKELAHEAAAVVPAVVPAKEKVPARELAPLNGNRGFSLLRR
jgi:hypothetical protein